MLSQSCTGLSPLPDHQDAHFPGMAPPPHHYHHPGLGPMMQGHFGYGQSPPSMEAQPESAVSSSGIPYTPQPSPAKQQQQQHAEFPAAASPVKGVPGSPASGSAYGSSPMRYPGTPPKDSGYILPSPAKQLFPSETGGNAAGYPSSSQYPSSYSGHQSDQNQMQGYGYGHYQQSASGQPSSTASYGNQYGNLV